MKKELNNTYEEEYLIVERSLINLILENANISINDNVIELNPGRGSLSETIAKRSKVLTCIGIKRENEHFLSVLKDKYSNVNLIYGDFLIINSPLCDKIIAASVLELTIEFINKIYNTLSICNIIQVEKSIAEKILAKENDMLSIYINSLYEINKIADIKPTSYNPNPTFDVILLKLSKIDEDKIKYNFKKYMIRELFNHKEKKVKNILMESLIKFANVHNKKITKKESKSIIEEYDFSKQILNKVINKLEENDFQIIYNKLK